MITYRETKRISLSDSNLHSLTGNAHFCRLKVGMKPFLAQITFVWSRTSTLSPARSTRMDVDCKKWK